MTDAGTTPMSEIRVPLCIAACGDYRCERPAGHDGPHTALKGDFEWQGMSVPRVAGSYREAEGSE